MDFSGVGVIQLVPSLNTKVCPCMWGLWRDGKCENITHPVCELNRHESLIAQPFLQEGRA